MGGIAAVAELGLEQQTLMVRGLQQRLAARHGGQAVLIETHISLVLVLGDHAYKIKKALRTPFLDQSTLALRQRACHEELRLNRRLAPELYLAVVPITGTVLEPEFDGGGTLVDVAVKMRAFAQDGLWDALAARGQLGPAQVDELVRVLDRFHAAAAVAEPGGRYGSPEQVRAPLLQSLDELQGRGDSAEGGARLHELRAWEAAAFQRLRPLFTQRLAQGRVRECHGDLHLGNVTVADGHSIVFDGIDFNDDFRWIDVMSEIAFMAMDLHAHGLTRLAHRFINGYLELCGDYAGVPVLNYYRVHRALVRAKVHGLRAAQCSAGQGAAADAERAAAERYLQLALSFCRHERAGGVLMLTHGFSGSGKSTLTQGLLEIVGAIRIRSDVERKRLAGLGPLDRGHTEPDAGLYGPDTTAATYVRLGQLATPVLEGGFHAILDATFLMRTQRDAARQLAARLGVRCAVLAFEASPEALRQRLRERASQGFDASDADEAVLRLQMSKAQPLQDDETGAVFRSPTVAAAGRGEIEADWTHLLEWLAVGVGR
jgi:aminoglycoside phosphotransferase family enzyme/predicted kinase